MHISMHRMHISIRMPVYRPATRAIEWQITSVRHDMRSDALSHCASHDGAPNRRCMCAFSDAAHTFLMWRVPHQTCTIQLQCARTVSFKSTLRNALLAITSTIGTQTVYVRRSYQSLMEHILYGGSYQHVLYNCQIQNASWTLANVQKFREFEF